MQFLKKIKRLFIHPDYAELLMNRTELLRRVLLYKDHCYGAFIGTDKFGNRYYHNSESVYGRNRFVIHYYQSMFYVEPTQIDPEWFRWLHYTTGLLIKIRFSLQRYTSKKLSFEWKTIFKTSRSRNWKS